MEHIKELYLRYKEIIHYLIAGVLTTVVSLVSYFFCVETFLNPNNAFQLQIANVISWICAVTFAYFVNRIFVFESRSKEYLREASAFIAGRVSTLIMDMVIMFVLVTLLKCNDKIAKLVVQVAVTVANYVISKLFVFNQ